MFHMTNDSGLFKTCAELEDQGYYPIEDNRLKKGDDIYVPLYEGKMIQMYDHRAAKVVVNDENVNRPAQPENTNPEEYAQTDYFPDPQFWVTRHNIPASVGFQWSLSYKMITAPTNMRTLIGAMIPESGVGNSIGMMIRDQDKSLFKELAHCILANINSFPLDFVIRQKVQGQNINWYIVEQLPVIPPEMFEQPLGNTTIADFIKDHVLHLTYTAWDMQPFAKDMGYDGDPFIWDEEDRRHRRAKLDALFFNLYEINEDDADYILSTFPIVKRHDEEEHGRY